MWICYCGSEIFIPSSAVLINESVQRIIGITAAVVVKPTQVLRNSNFGNVAIQRQININTRLLLHVADEGEFSYVYAAMTNRELVQCHAASKWHNEVFYASKQTWCPNQVYNLDTCTWREKCLPAISEHIAYISQTRNIIFTIPDGWTNKIRRRCIIICNRNISFLLVT